MRFKMGFLSFNEMYFTQALGRLEGRTLDKSELYEAKQLLKLLDDLIDERYTLLNRTLEEKYGAVSRLQAILKAHDESPFPIQKRILSNVEYGDAEMEVESVCERLSKRMQSGTTPSDNPFLADLIHYCQWIPQQSDTAYVFLLRDAFLPYLYFRGNDKSSLYPWVINRDFLWQTAEKGVDDFFRLPVYEALESGISGYEDFSAFCRPRIRKILRKYTVLEKTLRELLGGIQAEKILVIESGYCGTVPLTLAALDDRVDFRLYTTAPFLYDVYREKIFCQRYENIRSFELLYAQDALMKFSSFRNGRFYVKTAAGKEIWEKAVNEYSAILSLK